MDLAKFHAQILQFYETSGRKELPWRCFERAEFKGLERAYIVYVSEIMLQQTQVVSVLPRFFEFLKLFPNLKTLAKADESTLLKAWQGLGYYSRARNLQKSAQRCVSDFGACLPQRLQMLQTLPGIGAYTAGAVACFGYLQAVSFVDGNIKRLLCRLFALESPSAKELEDKAEFILNRAEPFNHNQALIDLGALICTPKAPKCGLCPVYEFCAGKFSPQNYPKPKKIAYESLDLALFIKEFNARFAVQKSERNLYKGMYNFEFGEAKTSILPKKAHFIGEFKHSYTKYRLNIKIYYQKLSLKEFETERAKSEFKSLAKLEAMPLSSLSLKALRLFKASKFFKGGGA